jgi:hypothetical protein
MYRKVKERERSLLTVLKPPRKPLSAFGVSRRWVDLVREDVFGVGLGDGQIEPDQQLGQGLTLAAYQHGQAVVSVAGGRDTPDGTECADSDFAILDQRRDVGQVQGTACGVLLAGVVVYATCCISGCTLAATFHGSNSWMWLIG